MSDDKAPEPNKKPEPQKKPDDAKKYSLKPNESQLLAITNNNFMNMIANILSFVCVERLAHQVDGNTAFELAPDMKSFEVWQKEPVNRPEDVPNKPKPIVPSAGTADAIGGK